ncbi:hypothetical protein [Burkholderia gladioli]|uniref:hypothetical protein n=1 Tax=Burkholderia gladioli TaxID=28095 RepID=UPI000CFE66DF|nr:hypothetical protein [Burkholderia gladioli]PRH13500.1 hypothetical protein C6V08_00395 [Burkholderia gladioli]
MSTRTIIEINHYYLQQLLDDPLRLAVMVRSACLDHQLDLNERNAAGMVVDVGTGIRIITRRHHTERVSVGTQFKEIFL